MDNKNPEQTMIDNLKKNTGKSLEEWITIVNTKGFAKHGEYMKFLKEQLGLTHGFANLIALKARGADAGSAANTDDLITSQYNGKESLYPIYEHLLKAIKAFGGDVEIAPKNNYVSLRRKKQFALIQPSTKTRIDLGINLKGTPPAGRLESAGTASAMCSHKVKIEQLKDADKEVINWLKAAYDAAG